MDEVEDAPKSGGSAEPSMEEILASIRRIIAEDDEAGEAHVAEARDGAAAPATPDPELLDENGEPFSAEESELLELAKDSRRAEIGDDKIISDATEEAASEKVSNLSSMMVRGYEGSTDTLEGMIRELLRPMLKEWLDANLSEIVEQMVSREIERITRK